MLFILFSFGHCTQFLCTYFNYVASPDRITICHRGNEWPNGSCNSWTPIKTTSLTGRKHGNCASSSNAAKSWDGVVKNCRLFATQTLTRESRPMNGSVALELSKVFLQIVLHENDDAIYWFILFFSHFSWSKQYRLSHYSGWRIF